MHIYSLTVVTLMLIYSNYMWLTLQAALVDKTKQQAHMLLEEFPDILHILHILAPLADINILSTTCILHIMSLGF